MASPERPGSSNQIGSWLIVFGGLPGSGKTTIAREVARALSAVHVRVDSIEQALRNSGLVVERDDRAAQKLP
jgi:predicted kinase